jgi:enoyl-[acyl-carrier-protein] reductase (NADH)
MPETGTIREAFGLRARAAGMTPEQFQQTSQSMTHLRRLPTLTELANVAAFITLDRASAMTGTVANLSGGAIVY